MSREHDITQKKVYWELTREQNSHVNVLAKEGVELIIRLQHIVGELSQLCPNGNWERNAAEACRLVQQWLWERQQASTLLEDNWQKRKP
jgi:hypothetical protein